jgi:hypothetical protein
VNLDHTVRSEPDTAIEMLRILDMAAKRHKKHKSKISHFIISIGYEIEIQEF